MMWYYGGSGNFANTLINLPFTNVPYEIHIYALSHAGYFAF